MATPTDPPATPATSSASVSGTVARASATTDAVQLLDDVPLTEAETEYVEAARAANTLRGYRSDWTEFTPGAPSTAVTRYRQPHPRSPDTCPTWPRPGRRSAR